MARKKRSIKSIKQKLYSVLGLILFVFLYLQRGDIYKSTSTFFQPPSVLNNSIVYVQKVYDGDTFLIENSIKIRLIGVDTPESSESNKLFRDSAKSGIKPEKIIRLGKISYSFTKKMCEHKRVRLEFDNQKKDRYGRLLAYVYLPDGQMLNELIIRSGYGFAYIKFPFKEEYRSRFIFAQEEAKKTAMGLWHEKPGLFQLEKANRS